MLAMRENQDLTPAPPAPLLEVRGVVKDYQGLRPLRVRALRVAEGEVLTLDGLDAQAAEMFVHLLTGAALPDDGEVALFGRNTREVPDAAEWLQSLEGLGLVSGRAVLLDMMTVLQNIALPLTLDGARILLVKDRALFSAYVPNPKGPVFMTLIEKTFGKTVTTRTWETVGKIVKAAQK